MRSPWLSAVLMVTVSAGAAALSSQGPPKAGDAALGTQKYDNYERPAACATCHIDIAASTSRR